jgi:hypothetical protein
MKKLTLLLILVLVVGISANAFAQATASASTSATIVAPIGITKNVDMAFGNIATTTASGTVTLSTAGVRTAGGGVTLPATTGTVTAASFDVSGSGNYGFSITLPGSAITLDNGSGNTVTVGTFVSNPSGTGALTAGAQTVLVGATLNIPAATVAGDYSNASDLKVTVNYN